MSKVTHQNFRNFIFPEEAVTGCLKTMSDKAGINSSKMSLVELCTLECPAKNFFLLTQRVLRTMGLNFKDHNIFTNFILYLLNSIFGSYNLNFEGKLRNVDCAFFLRGRIGKRGENRELGSKGLTP